MAGWSHAVSAIRRSLWRVFWRRYRHPDAGGDEHSGALRHSSDERAEEFFRRMYKRSGGVLFYLGPHGLLAVRGHHGDGGYCGRIRWRWVGAAYREDRCAAHCDSDWVWDGGVVVCEVSLIQVAKAPTPLRSRFGSVLDRERQLPVL